MVASWQLCEKFQFRHSADEEDDGDPEECCVSQEQLEGTDSDEVRSINFYFPRFLSFA